MERRSADPVIVRHLTSEFDTSILTQSIWLVISLQLKYQIEN